jgi:hypothetical protein
VKPIFPGFLRSVEPENEIGRRLVGQVNEARPEEEEEEEETPKKHSVTAYGYTAILDTSDWTVEIFQGSTLVGVGGWRAGRFTGSICRCHARLPHPSVDEHDIWEALDDGLAEALRKR